MTSLPAYLTGDTATGLANGALLGVAGLALLISYGLVVAVVRLSRNNKTLTKTNGTLVTRMALLDSRNERLGEANARLRQTHGLPPRRPMLRPGPPAEPTQAFAAPDATQRLRAYDGGIAT